MTNDNIQELKEQINVVVDARQRSQQLSETKKLSLATWEQDNLALLDGVALAIRQTDEAENRLRELTLQAYAETGNKAPAPGVGIRERTVLTYDGKVAFDWAKAHKMALKLDTTAFEKIAKVSPPEFVKITTEPQATIATNLEEKK